MNIYQNSALKFELKLEEGWKRTDWSEWKKRKRNIESYKDLNVDFPSNEITELKLMFAYERIQGSPSLMSKQIYIDSFWKEKDLNINEEISQNKNEFFRLISTEIIIGRSWQSLQRKIERDDHDFYHQIFISKFMPNTWIYASVTGDTRSNFETAKEQFLKISKLK